MYIPIHVYFFDHLTIVFVLNNPWIKKNTLLYYSLWHLPPKIGAFSYIFFFLCKCKKKYFKAQLKNLELYLSRSKFSALHIDKLERKMFLFSRNYWTKFKVVLLSVAHKLRLIIFFFRKNLIAAAIIIF